MRGYVYLMSEFFDLAGDGSMSFALQTNGVEVDFHFYDMTSTGPLVKAYLIEAPDTVTQFNYLTPRNLNRNFPDNASASLSSASAVTGGTVIATELIGNNSKAGGLLTSRKIHTLAPDTTYVMRFDNTINQAGTCHINLGWAELENHTYEIVNPVPDGE